MVDFKSIKKVTLCSDTHYEIRRFKQIVEENEFVIQLGDMMLGMGINLDALPKRDNYLYLAGNHANPNVVKTHKNYIGRYGYIKEFDTFYIDGALSPDYFRRKINKNWWPNEQLSHQEFAKAINLYKSTKPKYVIAHDCPFSVAQKFGHGNSSITQNTLEIMTYLHKPSVFYHGHYHVEKKIRFNGILFKCLPFLGTCELGK